MKGRFAGDGTIRFQITAACPADTKTRLSRSGIDIYDASSINPYTFRLCVNRADGSKLLALCEARGEYVTVVGREGIVFRLRALFGRPVLIAIILLWFGIALWLPTRILFVEVEGAAVLEKEFIKAAAENCGIAMGAATSTVRSESVKNALLTQIPDLQWAGITTQGCVATIHVKEKEKTQSTQVQRPFGDIYAAVDAIVRKITVRSGTAMCEVGKAVKKGQSIISQYRDNEHFLSFVGADGEVYGDTQRHFIAVTPADAYKREDLIASWSNYYIVIGKKLIKFKKDSGILDPGCVKMYDIKTLSLPGGFPLPVTLISEHILQYKVTACKLNGTQIAWLGDMIRKYAEDQLVKGEITASQAEQKISDGLISVHASYACYEMIAGRQ